MEKTVYRCPKCDEQAHQVYTKPSGERVFVHLLPGGKTRSCRIDPPKKEVRDDEE